MPRTRASLVVVVLGTGVLTAVMVVLWPWEERGEARGQAASDLMRSVISRLAGLEDQVSALENRIAELEPNRVPLREPVVPEPEIHVEEAETSLVELAERIAHLEQLENTRARRVGEREEEREQWASRARQQAPRDIVDAAHRTIRDRKVSDSDKAHAWLDLAQQEVFPWADDVIAEMTAIGLTSEDDRAREVVWIGAESEHRSALLVQPLISALGDSVAEVREEAADALSQYLEMPGVQKALLWTSSYDESERVRNEAARALRGEE